MTKRPRTPRQIERAALKAATPPDDWPAISRRLRSENRATAHAATIRAYGPALRGAADRCTYCGEAITKTGCGTDHAPAIYHLAQHPGQTGWLFPCCSTCNAAIGPCPATCATERAAVVVARPDQRKPRSRPISPDLLRCAQKTAMRLQWGQITDLCPCPKCKAQRSKTRYWPTS